MIRRDIHASLEELSGYYPVVLVNGPRQSGKTTLCQAAFPDLPYVTLEPLDHRGDAMDDPRGFLEEYNEGAIIDEVQYVPHLLNYLQEEVEWRREASSAKRNSRRAMESVDPVCSPIAGELTGQRIATAQVRVERWLLSLSLFSGFPGNC